MKKSEAPSSAPGPYSNTLRARQHAIKCITLCDGALLFALL
jgi:hypothetical protein